jgi:hypothetical protein
MHAMFVAAAQPTRTMVGRTCSIASEHRVAVFVLYTRPNLVLNLVLISSYIANRQSPPSIEKPSIATIALLEGSVVLNSTRFVNI